MSNYNYGYEQCLQALENAIDHLKEYQPAEGSYAEHRFSFIIYSLESLCEYFRAYYTETD